MHHLLHLIADGTMKAGQHKPRERCGRAVSPSGPMRYDAQVQEHGPEFPLPRFSPMIIAMWEIGGKIIRNTTSEREVDDLEQ